MELEGTALSGFDCDEVEGLVGECWGGVRFGIECGRVFVYVSVNYVISLGLSIAFRTMSQRAAE